MDTPQTSDLERVTACLTFIAANPTIRYPLGWIEEVREEGRALGLLPPLAARIGANVPEHCHCREYGGDMADVF